MIWWRNSYPSKLLDILSGLDTSFYWWYWWKFNLAITQKNHLQPSIRRSVALVCKLLIYGKKWSNNSQGICFSSLPQPTLVYTLCNICIHLQIYIKSLHYLSLFMSYQLSWISLPRDFPLLYAEMCDVQEAAKTKYACWQLIR